MNKEQMDVLLIKAVKRYVPGISAKLLDKVSERSEYEKIDSKNISYRAAEEKVMLIGKVLEEHEKTNSIIISILSGVGNSNMCILVLHVSEDSVEVDGFSKEGLINQHTTSKAIKKLRKQFENG